MICVEAKLLSVIFFIICIIMTKSIFGFALLIMLLFVFYKRDRIDRRTAFLTVKRLYLFFSFIILLNTVFYSRQDPFFTFYIFTPTLSGLKQGLLITTRTILILFYSEIVLHSGSSVRLAKAFERILYPLKFFFIPVQTLGMIFSLSFSFVKVLSDEVERIKKAQKLRGGLADGKKFSDRIESVRNLTLPLFLSAFHKADELSYALEARGYDPKKKIKYVPVFKLNDYIYVFMNITLCFLIFLGGKYVKY